MHSCGKLIAPALLYAAGREADSGKAQGPLWHTMIDFWEMVWLMKSPIIIMLTNLDEPDLDVTPSPLSPLHADRISVSLMPFLAAERARNSN